MSLISTKNVSKEFHIGSNELHALKEVSIAVEPGEFLAITGPSGSGKSTLLNILGCIEKPTSGAVIIDGRDITNEPLDALAGLRAEKIGYIFQTFNLLPVLTARENVEYPLHLRKVSAGERKTRVHAALQSVGLERYAEHKPAQLSGGQRQRVAIARALVGQPKVILADEPTANLDHATGVEILELMKTLNRNSGVTFIFSTHDQKIMNMASRIITLSDGEVTK